MNIVSINVGTPREVMWRGKEVRTSIFKVPVAGRVKIARLNIEGDGQADLRVHGGPNMAVYAYPSEHYEYWKQELTTHELSWGMFGENLTTSGLVEDSVCIGDQIRAGSALLMVTQPRMPCYKLGIRFGGEKMIKQFLDSRRTGFYFAVLEEGEAQAGDLIEWVHRDKNQVSVLNIVQLYLGDSRNPDLLQRAIRVEALPDSWRNHLLEG